MTGKYCFFMITKPALNNKQKNVTDAFSADDFEKIFENQNSDCTLESVSKKDAIWDSHRRNTEIVEQLYSINPEYAKYAERLSNCSNFLFFGHADQQLKLKKSSFCRVRYCPVCQWRKSLKWKVMMHDALLDLLPQYPNHRFIFLTLTVKNPPIGELKNTLQFMNNAWKKLTKRKEFGVVDGWVRTIEVTRDTKNPNTHAHPHFHCLLMVKPSYFKKNYIKQMEWVRLWADCLNVDYLPSVNIQTIKPKNKNSDSYRSSIAETLKYSIKPDEIFRGILNASPSDAKKAIEWFFELTKQTHKMRFVATGGLFKNALKAEEQMTDDDLVVTGNDDDPSDNSDNEIARKRVCFAYKKSVQKYTHRPDLDYRDRPKNHLT